MAVVGAGVSGVYSAYKLAQNNHGWHIHVFETNNRVGGRLFSIDMPGISDFKADAGAMRFRKSEHRRLVRLGEELGLTTQPFSSPTEEESLFYIRGKLLNQDDINSGNVPYDMTNTERELSPDITKLWRYLFGNVSEKLTKKLYLQLKN